ncbi:hypothetical protein ACFVRU_44935, partial [Streptomyces sp. NPDC057927]
NVHRALRAHLQQGDGRLRRIMGEVVQRAECSPAHADTCAKLAGRRGKKSPRPRGRANSSNLRATC